MRARTRLESAARAVALLLAAAAAVSLALTLALRFFHPYDLEWMEGGVLCHALRLIEGKPIYAATLGVLGLPALWWLNRSTQGWFWRYVFELHQSHEFYTARAFIGTPGRLALLIGPALVVLPWALLRKRSPDLLYAIWLALVGIAVACVGYGTKWAFTNAFIPGVFFPAIAIGASLGVLASRRDATTTARGATLAWALVAIALLTAPGGLQRELRHRLPRAWWLAPKEPSGYDPRPFIPTALDRRLGDALIARLRAAPGEVLIPFHPFYGHLAGKRTFVHRMGVLDVGFAQLEVAGLQAAFNERRFSLIVMDDKIDGNWFWWPGLLANYQTTERIDGPQVVSGSPTRPRYVLTPKAASATNPAVEIDRELQ